MPLPEDRFHQGSILMAVRVEDIQAAYKKLENYRKGGKTNEETDAGEID